MISNLSYFAFSGEPHVPERVADHARFLIENFLERQNYQRSQTAGSEMKEMADQWLHDARRAGNEFVDLYTDPLSVG